jgi:hypothetical protein
MAHRYLNQNGNHMPFNHAIEFNICVYFFATRITGNHGHPAQDDSGANNSLWKAQRGEKTRKKKPGGERIYEATIPCPTFNTQGE